MTTTMTTIASTAATTLRYNYNTKCKYASITVTLLYSTCSSLLYTTVRLPLPRQLHYNYTTLHCTNYITLPNYTTTTTTTPLHYNYSFSCAVPQHRAIVGEVAAATIAAISKNAAPTTLQSISGFILPSMHNSSCLLSALWNFRRLARYYWY